MEHKIECILEYQSKFSYCGVRLRLDASVVWAAEARNLIIHAEARQALPESRDHWSKLPAQAPCPEDIQPWNNPSSGLISKEMSCDTNLPNVQINTLQWLFRLHPILRGRHLIPDFCVLHIFSPSHCPLWSSTQEVQEPNGLQQSGWNISL